MKLKKILIVSLFAGLFNIPCFVYAADGIHTKNYTNEPSSVRITSSVTKFCSATFGAFTPPKTGDKPGISDVSWGKVNALCNQLTGTCTADIYMTNNCSGTVYGSASLDLGAKVVTAVDKTSKYHFDANGTNLTITYK